MENGNYLSLLVVFVYVYGFVLKYLRALRMVFLHSKPRSKHGMLFYTLNEFFVYLFIYLYLFLSDIQRVFAYKCSFYHQERRICFNFILQFVNIFIERKKKK